MIYSAIRKLNTKKNQVALPEFLGANPILSGTFHLIMGVFSEKEPQQKDKNISEIACVLDFTTGMESDLQLIRYETDFLSSSNQALIQSCEQLFADYTKVIQYFVPLESCRREDKWEELYYQLDRYMEDLQNDERIKLESLGLIDSKDQAFIDIEFATERVVQFVREYQSFIAQSNQYYQKFDNILGSYANEERCIEQLPHQYNELKYDVTSTLEKFQNTYQLPEINGSRMKSILYGFFSD